MTELMRKSWRASGQADDTHSRVRQCWSVRRCEGAEEEDRHSSVLRICTAHGGAIRRRAQALPWVQWDREDQGGGMPHDHDRLVRPVSCVVCRVLRCRVQRCEICQRVAA